MNYMKKHLATALLVFVLISCQQKTEKEFYPNGNIKSESEMENGKQNGKTTTYYENGKVEMETMFKNDSIVDYLKMYYSDGMLSMDVNLKTLEGVYYAEDGLTFQKGKISRGMKNGLWVEYIRSINKKRFLWNYVDDVKEGSYTSYKLDGGIEAKGSYKKGTLDGSLYYFDGKGDTTKVQYWKADTNFSSSSMIKEVNYNHK